MNLLVGWAARRVTKVKDLLKVLIVLKLVLFSKAFQLPEVVGVLKFYKSMFGVVIRWLVPTMLPIYPPLINPAFFL